MNNILKSFTQQQDTRDNKYSMHKEELRFRTPDGERPFQCEFCKRKLWTQRQVAKHLSLHAKAEIYQCEVCPQKFQWKLQLTKHFVKFHAVSQECDFCHKKYKHQSSSKLHLKYHAEKLTCKVCDRVLDDNDNFTRHMRSHRSRNKKTFKCKLCSDKFSSESLLVDLKILDSAESTADGDSSKHFSETNKATCFVDEVGDIKRDIVKVEEVEDQGSPVECKIKIEHHELPSEELEQLIKVEMKYT